MSHMDESHVMSLLTIKGMGDKTQKKMSKMQHRADEEKKKKESVAGVRYKPCSIESICQQTKFNKREVQIMYRGFKQECPTGIVNDETFRKVYNTFFPQGDASQYSYRVFRALDSAGNGSLTFEEFMLSLSRLVYGSTEEKVKWAFSLYDQDRDGVISLHELSETISSIYAMLGSRTDPPVDSDTIDQHIDRIYQQIGSVDITYDAFAQLCHKDQEMELSFREFWTDLRLRN